MCTAILVNTQDGYFGRNLDYDRDFGEKIVIVPKGFGLDFCQRRHAIMGMAVVADGYPLLFDGINDAGLGMAGLRFAGNCVYNEDVDSKINIASYQLILLVLSECKSVAEAKTLLTNINITNKAFSKAFPPSPLHWMIADKTSAITVEQTKSGLNIYDNPVGVLTNNPEFPAQLQNLANYMQLSASEPKNTFSGNICLTPYSNGMGAMGLPGDFSSMSRFVKASFIRENSVYGNDEGSIVNHFFHTLYSVFQQRGCVRTRDGFEITNYSCCCNLTKGIYYYTTYNGSTIRQVRMQDFDTDGDKLMEFLL